MLDFSPRMKVGLSGKLNFAKNIDKVLNPEESLM
jgi:hypothetical protein